MNKIVMIMIIFIGIGLFGVDSLAKDDIIEINVSVSDNGDAWVIKNDGIDDLNVNLRGSDNEDTEIIIEPNEQYEIKKMRSAMSFRLYSNNELIYEDGVNGFVGYTLTVFIFYLITFFFLFLILYKYLSI